MTRERSVELWRMLAVSAISTINVDWPRERSSLAPMRLKTLSMMPMCAFFGGDEGTHLGKNSDEGCLTNESGFAGHVGPGNQIESLILCIEEDVIRNESFCGECGFNDGMSALRDMKNTAFIVDRSDIVVF